MSKTIEIKTYKFVKWDVPEAEKITYENEKALVKRLNEKYSCYSSTLFDFMRFGYEKWRGYIYDYRPYLKKYLYKKYGGGWREVYAPSKTALRKAVGGRIEKIVELKN